MNVLMSRSAWSHALLDRASAKPDFRAQINAAQRAALMQHATASIAERATMVFGAGAENDRQKVIDRYLDAIRGLAGDRDRGSTVFVDTCSACHRFGSEPGGVIGPDLAVVNDRSPGYLLTHILDPNRAVEDRFSFHTATMRDGREFAGMLSAEADNAITLRGLNGVEQVVFRRDLQSLVSSGRSLMPEGLETSINEQAMADLIAFLASTAPPPSAARQ